MTTKNTRPPLRLASNGPIPFRPAREPITIEEIQAALDDDEYPPILTLEQAARLLQLSPHTLYKMVGDGRLRDAVKRGKPLRFWRDRLIQTYFAQ